MDARPGKRTTDPAELQAAFPGLEWGPDGMQIVMDARRRLPFLLGALAAALVVSAAALAETIVNQTLPFSGTAFNSCTDELVMVTGNIHTTTRVTVSGSRIHEGVTVHITGVKGTTLAGATYVETDVTNQETNFSTDLAPSEFTSERTMNLTRLGEDGTFVAGDDLRVHVIAHMTVNANGVVTVDKDDASVDCR